MLKREIGKTKLALLSAVVLRDFIDRRVKAGAGGVTIAADLSFLSAVLKWGRHARQLDIPDRLALRGAREPAASGPGHGRSRERDRGAYRRRIEAPYGLLAVEQTATG